MTEPTYGGLTVVELRALHEKATPGPWRAMRDGNQYLDGGRTIVGASRLEGPKRPWNARYVVPAEQLEEVARFTDDDADLIAAVQRALPDLLAAVEAARIKELGDENERMREALTKAAEQFRYYERKHQAKAATSSDSYESGVRTNRAILNREYAEMCEAALGTTPSPEEKS
jgi:hypothetical protein